MLSLIGKNPHTIIILDRMGRESMNIKAGADGIGNLRLEPEVSPFVAESVLEVGPWELGYDKSYLL